MRAIAWARANLFNGPINSLLTLLALYFILRWGWTRVDWGLISAVWSAPDGRSCRAASEAGACWAFIARWYRFILFGRYPFVERWRPTLMIIFFMGLVLVSCDRRMWRRAPLLTLLWILGLIFCLIL